DAASAPSLAGVQGRSALVDQAHGGPPPSGRDAAGRREAWRGLAEMKAQTIETRKGARCRVLEAGSGMPVVFLHGAGRLLADNPFLDGLAPRYHVVAPERPGYGASTGEEPLAHRLDFTLHG